MTIYNIFLQCVQNRCICCGDIIPEGRQICPTCERKYIIYKT